MKFQSNASNRDAAMNRSVQTTHDGAEVLIRELQSDEYPLLADFLYEAIFVPEGMAAPSREVVNDPALRPYWAHFGAQEGDRSMAAVVGGQVIGAAWVRRMRGYGFVAEEVPELSMALRRSWRGRGIGTRLLQALLAHLDTDGVRQVSLSVQRGNRAAWRLYKRSGFRCVRQEGEECILVCDLGR